MIAPLLFAAVSALADGPTMPPAELEVTGDSTCPTPAEVADRLAELLPPAAERRGVPAGTHVVVTHAESAAQLMLRGSRGEDLATRALPAEGSCADLASAAAVIVAAWRADLDPELAPAVHLPAPAAPPPVLAVSASPPPVALTKVPPSPRAFAVGLGLLMSETGGSFAPGATLAGWMGLGDRFALDASVFGATSRSADVGALPGVASWTRVALAVGPALAARRGRLRGSVHVQALAGLLHVKGVGLNLADAGADTTLQVGAAAGARQEIVSGTSAFWVGLDVCLWPGDQRLVVQNVSEQGHLSRVDVLVSAGLALGNFP
jgi:hypothetical protein